MKKIKRIPVCTPTLKGNELKYVTKTIKEGWISSQGPMVKEFEDRFARWLYGMMPDWKSSVMVYPKGYATSCTSGTTALELALHTLKIGKNYGGHETDEVIIPDFTMIAVANAVHWSGANPVLVDVEMDFRLNVDHLISNISKHTKALIVTHTYGIPENMDQIVNICKKYDIKLIEDCAEGLGATFNGQKCGTFGDLAMFSFYANKIITTGEGGMVTSKDRKIIERAHYLKNHTFSKEQHFWHKEVGHNFRFTALQAAIGLAQLENIDKLIADRIKVYLMYRSQLYQFLDKMDDTYFDLIPKVDGAVYWMVGVTVPSKFKKQIREELDKAGIETRSYFMPISSQKPYLDNTCPNVALALHEA